MFRKGTWMQQLHKDVTFEVAIKRVEEVMAGMWIKTQTDWNMNISQTMTEPVCPFVCFRPDHGKYTNGSWGDTIPEAIMNALDALERDLPKFIEEQASKWIKVLDKRD
jgi:hypothetical protein